MYHFSYFKILCRNLTHSFLFLLSSSAFSYTLNLQFEYTIVCTLFTFASILGVWVCVLMHILPFLEPFASQSKTLDCFIAIFNMGNVSWSLLPLFIIKKKMILIHYSRFFPNSIIWSYRVSSTACQQMTHLFCVSKFHKLEHVKTCWVQVKDPVTDCSQSKNKIATLSLGHFLNCFKDDKISIKLKKWK